MGDRIILLGLGGSHAYGTFNENSDIDFRGITLQSTSDLLGMTSFEQYADAWQIMKKGWIRRQPDLSCRIIRTWNGRQLLWNM